MDSQQLGRSTVCTRSSRGKSFGAEVACVANGEIVGLAAGHFPFRSDVMHLFPATKRGPASQTMAHTASICSAAEGQAV